MARQNFAIRCELCGETSLVREWMDTVSRSRGIERVGLTLKLKCPRCGRVTEQK